MPTDAANIIILSLNKQTHKINILKPNYCEKIMQKNILNKKIAPTILIIAFVLLFFVLNLYYNQDSAPVQGSTLACDIEIPIGESFEEAAEILQKTHDEIAWLRVSIFREIEAANKMIDLALTKCDKANCHTECHKSSFQCGTEETPAICHQCNANTCSGAVCPNSQINDEFNKIENAFNSIKGSSKRIKNIFKEKKEVEKKLYDARQKFEDCAISLSYYSDVKRGEKSPIYLLSCLIVSEEDYAREEEECKSLFNFFCCR